MFCAKCGRPVKDNAKFCTNCGAPVQQIPARAEQAPEAVQAQISSGAEQAPEAVIAQIPAGAEQAPEAVKAQVPAGAEQASEAVKAQVSAGAEQAPEAVKVQILAGAEQVPEAVQAQIPAGTVSKAVTGTLETPQSSGTDRKKKKRTPLYIVLGIVLAALIGGGCFAFYVIRGNMQYQAALGKAQDAMEEGQFSEALDYYEQALNLRPDGAKAKEGRVQAEYQAALQDGEKALEKGNYKKAQTYFKDALEVVPDGEEAKEGVARAVMGQAEECMQQEDFSQAYELLEKLEIDQTFSDYERYTDLLSAAGMNPEIISVDAGSFPVVSVTLSCGSEVTADQITVSESGQERALRDVKPAEGGVTLSYESDDAAYDLEHREFTVTLTAGNFTFQRSSAYDTPRFEQANVKLISSDVSAYPVIRAYFRVEKQSDGTTVENLNADAFQIQERLQGGEYLAREIRAVSPLESLGLNIDLVADKSSSISWDDMNSIKRVMIEFVNNLHYNVGDKAEVLAFDDIVQQMCYFTDDAGLLANGINNMATDGLTAFYDAVYAGIQNASLQGGARCVIAFTDGMDNRSIHTASEVINYANTNQVPVYIIGVGSSVDAWTLQDIATQTGGRYWFISDLYDLEDIFSEVYAEQKELYMVEYVSDPNADPYAVRELQTSVRGGGYKGSDFSSFTPAFSVQGLTHESHYELVPGTCTWEEANQRCQQMGGHLATITSQAELDEIIALAEQNDCKYVWLGGYTSYDYNGNVFGHWVTGEDFSFQYWGDGQPSRQDLDGTPEWYIMLWYVHGEWRWNDQRNDPAAVSKALNQNMCFICEYED